MNPVEDFLHIFGDSFRHSKILIGGERERREGRREGEREREGEKERKQRVRSIPDMRMRERKREKMNF